MKQLTDTKRLKVAMSILSEWQVDEYAERCRILELNCERKCGDCCLSEYDRRAINCPYLDVV